MNFVAVALLGAGLGVGHSTDPEYHTMTTRNVKLMIDYTPEERQHIRQVQLFASDDLGQTWKLEATATPDKDHFPFMAKDDGMYWFHIVVVFNDGTKDPTDVTRAANPQKILIDTVPPAVRIYNATRTGDEVTVQWSIEDQYPNPSKTRVAFRPVAGSEADWRDIPLPSENVRAVTFKPNSTGNIIVRVTAEDLAGNTQAATQEVGGITTSAFLATNETQRSPAPAMSTGQVHSAPDFVIPTMANLPPPTLSSAPTAGAPSAPVVELTNPAIPAPVLSQPPAAVAAPAPIAVGSGMQSSHNITPTAPDGHGLASVPELPPPQVINFAQFELSYHFEAGPSGIRQIDLYVTRDDGRTWTKWSSHDGKESPLNVNLQPRFDQRPDGKYGLKLVPVSGAGLSDEPPRPGTAPDFRVLIDTIPPVVRIYPPEADPNNRQVLHLIWTITEENLAKDPVCLEWSDSPNGPWRSVVAGDAIIAAGGGQSSQTTTRIANTGRYAWTIPANLPTHMVYLKVTAWDAAGNKSEVVTPEPILVDLTKPTARIHGVRPPQGRP